MMIKQQKSKDIRIYVLLIILFAIIISCSKNPTSSNDKVINWEGHESDFNTEFKNHILFTSNRYIGTSFSPSVYIMKSDGSDLKALCSNWFTFSASWSPRRWKIIYIRDSISVTDKSYRNLYSMNYDGTEHKRLTPVNEFVYFDAKWSPDGQKIAYIEIDTTDEHGGGWIRVIKPDGSNSKIITSTYRDLYALSWSNDSKQIVFSGFKPGNPHKLYIIDSNGDHLKALLEYEQPIYTPTWNPKSDIIAFQSYGPVHYTLYSNIFTYDINTKKIEAITNDAKVDFSPTWSSDGKSIIYSSQEPGIDSTKSIMRVNIETKIIEKLTDDLGNDWNPNCSK